MRRKDRWEKRLDRVPVLQDTDDPPLFVFLGVLFVAVTVGLLVATNLFSDEPSKAARDHVLQISAGVLVLIGAYTAVRTTTTTRDHTASQRLTSTLALLGSSDEAVQIGAIYHLPRLARMRGAANDQDAIRKALEHLRPHPRDPSEAVAQAVECALDQLPAPDEVRAR
jgi:hypothetical protein